MTGRSVPLWVGSTPDAKVPASVARRIFDREGGRCSLSGREIRAGDKWDLDHVIPLSMGGRHSEDNLKPALRDKHQEKTAAEAGPRAKADRIRAKHLGLNPKPKGNNRLRSCGFDKRRSV